MAFSLGRPHASLMLVFILLGFLLATAFNTQQQLRERPGPRKSNLAGFIEKQRQEQKNLGAQLAAARKELGRVDSERAERAGVLAAHSGQLELLRERAGQVPVRGPGLELTIGDAPRIPPGTDPESYNNYLVQDDDLQIVVNALWRGGAEALGINGERFVVGTGIRSAGSTILINSRPLGGPYHISAIGDPRELETALENDSDAALLLGEVTSQYGLALELRREKQITLPGYTGRLRPTEREGG